MILELFSGSGRHGHVVQRTLQDMLQVRDSQGNLFIPAVDLLRLDVNKETDNNPEILCDITQWNADLITKLKMIYANKQVMIITLSGSKYSSAYLNMHVE